MVTFELEIIDDDGPPLRLASSTSFTALSVGDTIRRGDVVQPIRAVQHQFLQAPDAHWVQRVTVFI